MINIFEAVTKEQGRGLRIFLAGGITNCPDWQSELIEILKASDIKTDLDIYNPRRKNFPIHDKKAAEEQIKWEFDRLKSAYMRIFWFSKGSLNPIVLYELGMWGNSRNAPIIIGLDGGYERRQDVIIQTMLARLCVLIVCSLESMALEIKNVVDERRPYFEWNHSWEDGKDHGDEVGKSQYYLRMCKNCGNRRGLHYSKYDLPERDANCPADNIRAV